MPMITDNPYLSKYKGLYYKKAKPKTFPAFHQIEYPSYLRIFHMRFYNMREKF